MTYIYKNPNIDNQFVITCDHDDDDRLLVEGGLDSTDYVWFSMRSNGFDDDEGPMVTLFDDDEGPMVTLFDDDEGPMVTLSMDDNKFNAFISELIDIQARRNGAKPPSEKCVGWDAKDGHPFYDKNGIQ